MREVKVRTPHVPQGVVGVGARFGCLHLRPDSEFDHVIRPKGANYAFGVSRADGVRIPETN
jgi:hypothetical protein